MPTWGQSQGGTLNDEQIKQLTLLITEGTGWAEAKEYAVHGFPAARILGDASDGLTLSSPLDSFSTLVCSTWAPSRSAFGSSLTGADDGEEVNGRQERLVERPYGTTKAAAQKGTWASSSSPSRPIRPRSRGRTLRWPAVRPAPCRRGRPRSPLPLSRSPPSASVDHRQAGAAGQQLTSRWTTRTRHPHNIFFKGADATGEASRKPLETGVER
jgi:hypothetical protein